MLREIINFTNSISPDSYEFRIEPVEGIHIMITLKSTSELEEQEYAYYKKGLEITKFLKECISLQEHTKHISMNKAFDAKKKIHSCSPFCIAFKIKTINEVNDRFNDYFRTAENYCDQGEQKKCMELFRLFAKNELLKLVQKDIEEIEKEQLKINKRFKFADNTYIYVYLKNVPIKEYQQVYQKYLAEKVFNKEEFNQPVEGELFGVSDYLSTFADKKIFLKHQTATFDISYRLKNFDALALFKFSQLQEKKLLPNPLPIFIDKEELNDTVVKIFNREGEVKIRYSEIIREVYNRERDLGNYYLLNYFGKTVRDFDFVSSFSFRFDPPLYVKDLLGIKKGAPVKIDDIFAFEKYIVQRIFNNQLIQQSKDGGLRYRYFDDIDYNPQYISGIMFQLVFKYRKAFYDYIYKSRHEALNSRIFYDIMLTGIIDNLRQDKYENNNHTKEYQIKEKLNIWLSLYEFFDQQKNGEDNMANKIKNLQARMQEIANDEYQHVESDEEFSYAAGQVIYYLLEKSEAGNKTHALLEPFLQKTDLTQFKMAISRIFNQYKHAISFHKGRFEKLMAEVLSYEVDNNLKELTPFILAGYFAKSVIYMKKEESLN